jgi:hypothetical protein
VRAATLRDFLKGIASVAVLAADLQDAWRWHAPDTRELRMDDLTENFAVEPAHLVRLCDVVIAGELAPDLLEPIGFAAIASDHFTWDGDTEPGARVAETLYDWSCPEVNFALTIETVRKFRHRLLTGENLLTREDHFRGSGPAPRSVWNSQPTSRSDAG